jgi:tRNA(fMet)-specific endonuclease VapC
MANAGDYLLDTNILLHWIRGKAVATALETQFQFSASPFKPVICEVSLGELYAFARNPKWGEWGAAKLKKFDELRRQLVAIDISAPEIVSAYADIATAAHNNNWPIFHEQNDLWIAAATKVSGLTLLTMDAKAFVPLRGTIIPVLLLDAKTGNPS